VLAEQAGQAASVAAESAAVASQAAAQTEGATDAAGRAEAAAAQAESAAGQAAEYASKQEEFYARMLDRLDQQQAPPAAGPVVPAEPVESKPDRKPQPAKEHWYLRKVGGRKT
jgi:hypothetical protein